VDHFCELRPPPPSCLACLIYLAIVVGECLMPNFFSSSSAIVSSPIVASFIAMRLIRSMCSLRIGGRARSTMGFAAPPIANPALLPAQNGRRLNDDDGFSPSLPDPRKNGPQQSVAIFDFGFPSLSLVDVQLVLRCDKLGHQAVMEPNEKDQTQG
jgi:hypothetical protein